jgi:pimeloyl-ACP methyl ester carboxylesterase
LNQDDIHKRPIIFVHGAWHGAWCWDRWIGIFRKEKYSNLIAVELRGHGFKTGSFKRARLEDYVDDVKTIIDNLDTEPILIGHSLGCTIIQHLCGQQQFPAAILLAPVPKAAAFKKIFLKQVLAHPLIALNSIIRRNMSPWVTSRVSPRLFFSDRMSATDAADYTARMQGESFRLFMLDLLRDVPHPMTGTPMLVVAAQDDHFIALKMQERVAADLHADFLVVGSSGHDIMLDVASYQAAEEVIGWLKANNR